MDWFITKTKRMLKPLIFYILIFICCAGSAQAQESTFEYTDTSIIKTEAPEAEVQLHYNNNGYQNSILVPDTSLKLVTVKSMQDTVNKWQQSKEFFYLQNLDSLLAKEQAEQDAKINKTIETADKGASFFSRLFNASFFKIILWSLALLALIYILYKLFLSKGLFSMPSAKLPQVTENVTDELLPLANYHSLIQQSIANNDYQLSTRYLFLQTLKLLNDKALIVYTADKTNQHYLNELPNHLKMPFKKLVMHYNYIWYGKVPISNSQFEEVHQLFKTFNG